MQTSQLEGRKHRSLTRVLIPLALSFAVYLSYFHIHHSSVHGTSDALTGILHEQGTGQQLANSHAASTSRSTLMRQAGLRFASKRRRSLLASRDGFLQSMASALTSATGSGDTTTAQADVTNPLGRGQDPSPYSRLENGVRTYYFPTIDFGTGVYFQTSTNLNTVLSDPSNEKKVFTYDKQVGTEAPAFFPWDDNNNLLVISSVGPQGDGLLRMLHSTSDNLLTGWQDLGPIKDASGNKLVNYDGYIFQHPNGKRYLLYSALKSILITQLTSFNTVGKSLTIVTGTGQVIEAPAAYISGDTLNLLWSENGFATPEYNTRRRAVSTFSDPLDPNTWRFADSVTILQSGNGVYGTGSVGVYTGPDGQPWLAFTCFYNPDGFPQTTNPRRVQTQPLVIENDVIQTMKPETPTGDTGTT